MYMKITLYRYKMDIAMLDKLLDASEEEKLEKIKTLVEQIQEIRKTNPEVCAELIFSAKWCNLL